VPVVLKGPHAWAVLFSLGRAPSRGPRMVNKTCAKLRIAFWDYLAVLMLALGRVMSCKRPASGRSSEQVHHN